MSESTPPDEIQGSSSRLYNEDLAPAKERRWGAFSIFNVWTSDVHSLYGYFLAASLFLVADTTWKFVIGIGVGSIVIYALMTLVGNAGVSTGCRSRCWPERRSAPSGPTSRR